MPAKPKPPTPRARPTLARSVSQQLASIIESRGLTPYALGKAAGVDQCQISRFLSGQRDIKLATLDRLAAALGLDLVERPRGRKPAAVEVRPVPPASGPSPGPLAAPEEIANVELVSD